MKAVFYLLQTEKEKICEDNSQCFFWKKARHLWNNDLLSKMKSYQVIGPKESSFLSYHTIHFVEKLLANSNEEDLTKYNATMGLIHKWMTTAIKYRKQNICQRLTNSKKLREEREAKIEEEKVRQEDRAVKTEEEREKFETDNKVDIEKYQAYKEAVDSGNPPSMEEGEDPPMLPEFDAKYFMFSYDEEHPAIIIPAEVIDDTDNDWVQKESAKEDLITSYNEKVQEAI